MDLSNNKLFSETVRAGSRTYFFDVKTSKTGVKYLVITESVRQAENTFNRHKVMIFQEHLNSFCEGINKANEFIK